MMRDDIVLKISTTPEQNTGASLFVGWFVYLLIEWSALLSEFLGNRRGGVMVLQTGPILTRPGFQDLLNLGGGRKAIGHLRAALVGEEGVVSPPLWLQFFYHIFVSEMSQLHGCKAEVAVAVQR